MKTLYVSDLDGTLLNSAQTLSPYTVDVINRLAARGGCFSYATARSIWTASKATEGIPTALPVIVYNGCFVMENGTRRRLISNYFAPSDAALIMDALRSGGVRPIVYSFIDGEEKFSYNSSALSKGARDFIQTRKGDTRDRPVDNDGLPPGEVFYFTCIDEEARLAPLYERFRDSFRCFYQRDIYSNEQWLELIPLSAGKAGASVQLKTLLGCDRIVSFGDAVNDLELFSVSDECYAVENAHPALKAAATAVIGGNDADGVARWLEAHAL